MYGSNGGYGNETAFAGGGFMPANNSGPAAHGTGTQSFYKGKTDFNAGISPLISRQLNQTCMSEDGGISIDGHPVNIVTIVGRLSSKQVGQTHTSFVLHDGFGTADVSKTMDGDDQGQDETSAILENTYARVYGHLNISNGQVIISAFVVRPITDFNEVTYHILESIFVHAKRVTNTQGLSYGQNKTHASHASINAQTSVFGAPSHTPMLNDSHRPEYQPAISKTDELQQRVIAVYQHPSVCGSEVGLDVRSAAQQLPGCSYEDIMNCVAFLVNEGAMYNTMDECYKLTDA